MALYNGILVTLVLKIALLSSINLGTLIIAIQ